mgnify:CR=1 FL=1
MRKIIALLWLMLLCGTAWGMNYPEIGVCTGDSVRLRERPGTKSRILGTIDTGRQLVILGETSSGGQKWYKVDHPAKRGTAYILSSYVNGWYSNGSTPTGRDFVNVRLTFGITREKARTLFGKPSSTNFGGLQYPGIELMYDDGVNLSYVRVTRKGLPIAGVEVGDMVMKLVEMGMPEQYITDLENAGSSNSDEPEDGPEGWTYESATGETIFFDFGVNNTGFIIEGITWSRSEGVG